MMETILDQIPCGYLDFSDEGIIGQVNRRICEMTGYRNDELVDQHLENLLTPGAGVFYQTHLFPVLKLENRLDEVYLTLQHKNGKKIPVLINSERNFKTKKYKNRCIVVEMQRRSEFEDKLLLAKKQAERTSGEKQKAISMMSHELRTPLSVILSMVELLSDEFNGDGLGEHYEYLSPIKEASKNLARLADDILNFARLETGYFDIQTEVILLEEVLIKSYMMMMHDAEKKGVTINRGEKTELKILADRDRLQQIIMNLLNNAVKFTEPGGKIDLYTEKDSEHVKFLSKTQVVVFQKIE